MQFQQMEGEKVDDNKQRESCSDVLPVSTSTSPIVDLPSYPKPWQLPDQPPSYQSSIQWAYLDKLELVEEAHDCDALDMFGKDCRSMDNFSDGISGTLS